MTHKNRPQHLWTLEERHKEHPQGESMTVPDETLTIKEIMKKHVRGMRMAEELMRTPVYDSGADFDSEDLEEVARMDIFEREQVLETHKEKIREAQEKQKKFLEERDKKKKAQKDGSDSEPSELSEPDDEATSEQRPKRDKGGRGTRTTGQAKGESEEQGGKAQGGQ